MTSLLFIFRIIVFVVCSTAQHDDRVVSVLQISDMTETYQKFLIDYNKDMSRMNDPERVAIFMRNLQWIKQSESNGLIDLDNQLPYFIRINDMADWLPGEYSSRFTVLKPAAEININSALSDSRDLLSSYNDEKSSADEILEFDYQNDSPIALLPSINWSSDDNPTHKPTMSPPQNQGLCGACWAFVAATAVESLVFIGGGKLIPLSVQELIDCDTSYNRGCDGGNPLYAFDYTITNALTSAKDYSYTERVCTY